MQIRRLAGVAAILAGLLLSTVGAASPARAGDSAAPVQPAAVGNYRRIVNDHAGKCVDVARQSTDAGAVVWEWECESDDNDNQLWLPIDLGTGGSGHLWLASFFPNRCLALSPNTSANGTSIVIGECSTTTAKYWHFE
jgi:hypothetical protein